MSISSCAGRAVLPVAVLRSALRVLRAAGRRALLLEVASVCFAETMRAVLGQRACRSAARVCKGRAWCGNATTGRMVWRAFAVCGLADGTAGSVLSVGAATACRSNPTG